MPVAQASSCWKCSASYLVHPLICLTCISSAWWLPPGFGIKLFFSDPWNVFDFCIIFFALVEYIVCVHTLMFSSQRLLLSADGSSPIGPHSRSLA